MDTKTSTHTHGNGKSSRFAGKIQNGSKKGAQGAGGKTGGKTDGAAGSSREDVTASEPRTINIADFAQARSAEINHMMRRVKVLGSKRAPVQAMPRHMRRRAAGHNSKRLPRRLHHQAEIEKAKQCANNPNKPDPKRVRSRRHRRRHSNLRQEFERRQRQHKWLETHLWHAKRFKMADMWGFRVPLHPSDKSARATYRACANHCLVEDVSYLGIIQVCGPQGRILQALSHLTSQQTGPTFADSTYLSGSHHGDVMLYHRNQYPSGAICPANFLWRAPSAGDDKREDTGVDKYSCKTHRQLWIWVHPACYDAALKEVEDACTKEADSCVNVCSLQEDFVRFRLRGPLSHPVILDALHIASVDITESSDTDSTWWNTYYANDTTMQAYLDQKSTWQALQGVQHGSELSPGCVVALTVRDPRILIPQKRTKIMADPEKAKAPPSSLVTNAPFNCMSALWDIEVRKKVKSTQISQHDLNKLTSEHLVPGTELNLGHRESRIPILLLQNPGARCNSSACPSKTQGVVGYGSGWDIVLPSGWGMAFWVALIYRGARAGGVRESRSCALQQGVPNFPDDYIDTAAGRDAAEMLRKELETKQAKWPPAKRPNYAKLGIPSPFKCEWAKLADEWSKESENRQIVSKSAEEMAKEFSKSQILVVRDKAKLQQLNKLIHHRRHAERNSLNSEMLISGEIRRMSSKRAASVEDIDDMAPMKKIKKDHTVQSDDNDNTRKENDKNVQGEERSQPITPRNGASDEAITRHTAKEVDIISSIGLTNPHMYVSVQVSLISKGAPAPFSVIYLPTVQDLSALASDARYGGPTEAIHAEYQLPKKQKKKRKADTNKEHKVKIMTDKLGLPNIDQVNLVSFCSRKVIGYVTNGAHAFSTGKGYGVGYCCMLGIKELLKTKLADRSVVVLIRDTGSLQYRMAYINVVI